MGIYEDITNDIGQAFNTDLADTVTKITHKAIEVIDYVPSEGTPQKLIVEEPSRAVLMGYDKFEIDNEKILPTDVKVLVLQDEFPTTPKVDDEIIELDNDGNMVKTYKVVSVNRDPALATYTIQCRTSSDTG